eukprot:5840069-Amphidinium_carterae.1
MVGCRPSGRMFGQLFNLWHGNLVSSSWSRKASVNCCIGSCATTMMDSGWECCSFCLLSLHSCES